MQLLHKNDMSIIFDLNMRYLDLVSLSRGHKLCLFIVKNMLNNLMMAEKVLPLFDKKMNSYRVVGILPYPSIFVGQRE